MKTIQGKLISSFALLILLSALMIVSGYYSFQSFMEGVSLTERITQIQGKMGQISNSEKDFLIDESIDTLFYASGSSENLQKSEWLSGEVRKEILDLNEEYLKDFELSNQLLQLDEMLKLYISQFQTFVSLKQQVGFKDWGKVGELRQAIHEVETSGVAYDQAYMLMLRRHEKDFLLRKDVRYLDKHNKDLQKFEAYIQSNASIEPTQKKSLLQLLENYKAAFAEVAKIEVQLGLRYDQGFRNELRVTRQNALAILSSLEEHAEFIRENKFNNGIVQFPLFFLGQLILGMAFAVSFSNRFAKRVKVLKSSIMQMAEQGSLSSIKLSGKDELNDLAGALSKLNSRIAVAIQFSNQIGEGNLDTEYPNAYRNGVLEKAFVHMQSYLQMAHQERDQENWISEGIMQAADLIRSHSNSYDECYKKLIALLVDLLEGQVGGFFLVEKEQGKPKLVLQASYAYGQDRFREKIINVDEGIIGQAYLDKEPLHITDIPKDYYQIFSGLGAMSPTALLVAPMIVNGETIGVFEVASLEPFQERHLRFCRKVAETIAHAVINQRQGDAFSQIPEWIKKREGVSK